MAGAALALPLLVASPAMAQGRADQAGATSIEEVIVTARRKAENIQDVPVSITALSPEQVRQKNVVRLEDLTRVAPSFKSTPSTRGNNSSTYTIRGQRGANTQVVLNDSPVGVYFAEMNLSRGVGTNLSLYDLESIQVLKGPQGTLFGRNSTGGAILIQPQLPTSVFEGYVQGSLGDYDLRGLEGAVNIPITDGVAVRLAGKIVKRDGYVTNVLNGQDLNDVNTQSYRASLSFEPTENIRSVFIGTYSESQGNGAAQKLVRVLPLGTPQLPGDPAASLPTPNQRVRQLLIATLQADLAAGEALGKYKVFNPFRQDAYDRARTIQNNTTIELGSITLKNIIGYKDVTDSYDGFNIEGGRTDLFHYENTEQYGQSWSEEFQIQGKVGKIDFVTGAYYFWERGQDVFDSIQLSHLASPTFLSQLAAINPALVPAYMANFPRTSHNDFSARNTATAVFAHVNYDLGSLVDGLSISLGGRYTWDKREVTYHNQAFAGLTPTAFRCIESNVVYPSINPLLCSNTYKIKSKEPTYDIGLNYQPTEELLFYITHRHGYRAGGFNPVPPSSDRRSFEPETLDDIEAGVKSDFELAGMPVRFNGAAYYGWYDDIQRQVGSLNFQGNYTTAVVNAAKAHISGLEFDLTIRPTRRLELTAGYSLIKPKYDRYSDLHPLPTVPPTFVTIDLTEAKFNSIPKHQLVIGGSWMVPMSEENGELSLRADYYYEAKRAAGDPDTRNCGPDPLNPYKSCFSYLAQAPSYSLVNLRADWRNVMGKGFDLAAYVTNVFDKAYAPATASAIGALGFATWSIGEPRMFGFELRVPFGGAAY